MTALMMSTVIREIIQTGFFIVIGTVAILTYLKAKKTLLQPIRTEIFKEQLKVFSKLLEMFSGKTEVELREEFHMTELFHANTMWLFDKYALHFFDTKMDEEKRPYGRAHCPTVLIPGHLVVKTNTYLRSEKEQNERPRGTSETRAATWMNYEFEVVKLPKSLTDKENELRRIIASPLVPQSLAELLQDFRKVIRKNVDVLRRVLTDCAKEMPEKYPNFEMLQAATTIWVVNRLNAGFEPLEADAKKISDFLRGYFTPDSLME